MIASTMGSSMSARRVARLSVAVLWIVAACTGAQAATSKIGVAAAVKNNVQGILGRTARALATGSNVFTNERIRTGEDSLAQILFLDKTTLMMGPRSELTLDKFVYSPRGTGQVVLNAVQGAFRFVTGSQNPRSYTVKTPVGSLGVRGTIVELAVVRNATTPVTYSVYAILIEGSAGFTYNGATYVLNRPGDYFVITSDGVSGPAQWDSSIINADLAPPMFGWYLYGNLPQDGPPGANIGGIDQLNGIIQHSLTPPPLPQYQIN
jgi:FecR protein